MTQPTIAQLHNLTDRAGAGLTADEQARLRAGVDRLEQAEAANDRVRRLADRIRRGVPWASNFDNLADRIIRALDGEQPAPLTPDEEARLAQAGVDTPGCDCGHDGMGVSWHRDDCPWRRGVVDCPGRELPGPAAHNDGPSVEECRDADRRWPLQKTGE